MNDFWDGAVVISTYTDADALDDGLLVDLGRGRRATRALYGWLAENVPDAPPDRWPVDLMEFVTGNRAVAMLRGLIDVNERAARRTYEENLDGGIWKFNADLGGDARTIWLVPNEVGGITAMFPEDY